MLLRLKPVKVITGARAAKAKHNLFAMVHIKAHLLAQLNTRQQKIKQSISVGVRKQLNNRCVMEAIANKEKPSEGGFFKHKHYCFICWRLYS
jgi:hypothetical protein